MSLQFNLESTKSIYFIDCNLKLFWIQIQNLPCSSAKVKKLLKITYWQNIQFFKASSSFFSFTFPNFIFPSLPPSPQTSQTVDISVQLGYESVEAPFHSGSTLVRHILTCLHSRHGSWSRSGTHDIRTVLLQK